MLAEWSAQRTARLSARRCHSLHIPSPRRDCRQILSRARQCLRVGQSQIAAPEHRDGKQLPAIHRLRELAQSSLIRLSETDSYWQSISLDVLYQCLRSSLITRALKRTTRYCLCLRLNRRSANHQIALTMIHCVSKHFIRTKLLSACVDERESCVNDCLSIVREIPSFALTRLIFVF